MSTDLVPYSDIERMAAVMGRGKMFGKTAEELLPLMLIAQAEHKHPAIAAQEYDVIQGRPAINSRSAQARFQSSGGTVEWLERTDNRAAAKFSHPRGGTLEVAWDMKRASQAQLTGKDNWKKYPAQMLAARVVAEGVRAVFPACLSGMYTVEEVQDFDRPLKPAIPEAPHVEMKSAPEQVTKPVEPEPKDPDYKAECKRLADSLGIEPEMRKRIYEQCGHDWSKVMGFLKDWKPQAKKDEPQPKAMAAVQRVRQAVGAEWPAAVQPAPVAQEEYEDDLGFGDEEEPQE